VLVREVLAIIALVTGMGHFSKQNLLLFILKRCQINWLVWGEDKGQSLLLAKVLHGWTKVEDSLGEIQGMHQGNCSDSVD